MRAEAIGTPRLILEPLLLDHAEPMAQALADPRLHTFMGGSPASPEQLRVRYRTLLAGPREDGVSWCNWALRTRADDRVVGTVGATVVANRSGGTAEVSWVLGVPWQGRGLAKEAALAMTAWLGERGVQVLQACIHPEHRASGRVAASAGLRPTKREIDGEIVWRAVLSAPPVVPEGRLSSE
ncbi:acetyltransferase, ribosomal protein N-acetylase [Actinoalloteichus sp. GBA129-24]|uniref:Acetyltransferase, ribosomal protein N-acetylase n=1 Tax=Actinoalloteichus fjordicus TaxID=1612552 RepID=A0AAC9LG89_9PSEU|nr:acetyltransferase, ribosomal protein N-acetylase [Actinoalloteichus fjordicus]APU22373.1 acetyltransferase, ribosomal protein N-acetylase [Actinoalloteichus sp. GBA129-24]